MAGIGDLLRLSGELSSIQAPSNGGSSGLMPSIQSAGEYLQRLVLAMEALVEVQRPAVVNYGFEALVGNGLFTYTAPFISRWVDVWIPAAAVAGTVQITFLDENLQAAPFPAKIDLRPGDFRSFAVASRGFQILFAGTETNVVYWR